MEEHIMKNLEELQAIRESMKDRVSNRGIGASSDRALERAHILVCGGTGCTSGHSKDIYNEFARLLKENGIEKEIKLIMTGCFGLCARGPIVVVYPDGAFYQHVKVSDVEEIVREHIVGGTVVERLLHEEKDVNGEIKPFNETAFYKSQHRLVLRHCGLIDPENIDEYLAFDGYLAYKKAVTEMTQQQVIDTIKASGLRGRGGRRILHRYEVAVRLQLGCRSEVRRM